MNSIFVSRALNSFFSLFLINWTWYVKQKAEMYVKVYTNTYRTGLELSSRHKEIMRWKEGVEASTVRSDRRSHSAEKKRIGGSDKKYFANCVIPPKTLRILRTHNNHKTLYFFSRLPLCSPILTRARPNKKSSSLNGSLSCFVRIMSWMRPAFEMILFLSFMSISEIGL